MAHISININLKAIPRELIRTVGDKAYIDLDIYDLREIDERGNDLSVQVRVPRDRQAEFPNRIYIGRGRTWEDRPAAPPAQHQAPAAPASDDPTDDLPF